MRIALITREYPEETGWGGISTFYHRFAQALTDAGHEVEVFAQGTTAARTERDGNVLVHRFVPRRYFCFDRCGGDLAGMNRHLGLFSVALAWEAARVFAERQAEAPFDIVEGQEHLGLNAFVNHFPARPYATVTRYHTAYHTFVNRNLVDWPASGLIKRLERISICSADCRISASHFIDKAVREDFPGVPAAEEVIPLLMPLEIGHIDESMRRKTLVFVGRFVPDHKRPHLAAEAFAGLAPEFTDWTIEFAGPDYPMGDGRTVWQVCESILDKYPGRYKYHGQLSRERVENLYLTSSIAVLPSRFESFGLVALEALACGCVPVVSDNTAMAEAVGDAGVVFRNGDAEDLKNKLSLLMSDPEILAERRKAGYLHAAEVTDTASLMQRNLDLFDRIIRKKRREA